MTLIYILAFLMLFIVKENILIYCLPIIYGLIGFGNSAYEMFDHIAIYENSNEFYKTSYVTFERFIEGIVTAFIPLLSYVVSPESSLSIKITFVIASAVYVILFMYVKRKYIE